MNYWQMLRADRLMNIMQLLFWPVYLLLSYWGNGIIPPDDKKFTLAEVAFITGMQAVFFYALVFLIWKMAYAKQLGRWLGATVAALLLLLPALVYLFYHALPTWFDLWVYRAGAVSALERIVFKVVQQYFHLGALAGLFVYRYYSVSEEVVKREATEQKLSYEIRFLTAAIDPHLLISMLTNLKLELGMMKTQAAGKLAAVVQAFAEMIAHGLRYAKDAVLHVPLAEELEQARRYIDVQCFRLNRRLPVYLRAAGCVEAWTVPPVLLNTLLGDVFKYGDTADDSHPATLRVDAAADRLRITCRNRIGRPQREITSVGLGSTLLKRLLQLAYPGGSDYHARMLPGGDYETTITITRRNDA